MGSVAIHYFVTLLGNVIGLLWKKTGGYIIATFPSNAFVVFRSVFRRAKNASLSTKFRETTEKHVTAQQQQKQIRQNRLRLIAEQYKHCFEFISSESKNVVVRFVRYVQETGRSRLGKYPRQTSYSVESRVYEVEVF